MVLSCQTMFIDAQVCPAAESCHQVIPPGMDFSYVTTQDTVEGEGDLKSLIGSNRAQSKVNLPPIWSEVLQSSLQSPFFHHSNSCIAL